MKELRKGLEMRIESGAGTDGEVRTKEVRIEVKKELVPEVRDDLFP